MTARFSSSGSANKPPATIERTRTFVGSVSGKKIKVLAKSHKFSQTDFLLCLVVAFPLILISTPRRELNLQRSLQVPFLCSLNIQWTTQCIESLLISIQLSLRMHQHRPNLKAIDYKRTISGFEPPTSRICETSSYHYC